MNTSTQHAVYFIAEIVLKSMAVVRFKLYRGLTAKCSVIGNKNIPPTVMPHAKKRHEHKMTRNKTVSLTKK
jgi:hypothetical protein